MRGASPSQHTVASSSRLAARRAVGAGEQVAARHVELVLQAHRHRQAAARPRELAVGRLDGDDAGAGAGRQHDHLVAAAQHAARRPARRSRGSRGRVVRPDHVLDREAARRSRSRSPRSGRSPGARAAAGRVPAACGSERSTTLSPCSAESGMKVTSARSEPRRPVAELARPSRRSGLVVVDQVHLVDATHHVAACPAARRSPRGGATARARPLRGVDQHQREVRGGGARDHVARVLHVPRRVGEDERAPRRREVAVGDVDRDPLLALRAQAVGEQRQVGRRRRRGAAEPPRRARAGRRGSPSRRSSRRPISVRLAVVHRAGGGHAAVATSAASQSSPSEVALALAVFHRGLGDAVVGAGLAALGDPRGGDLGDHLASSVAACERTAPVQLMSPTVR